MQNRISLLLSVLMLLPWLDCTTRGGANNEFLTLPLAGADGDWIVRNENYSITIPARVPGSIYTDLMDSGLLGDPYYRMNDVNYRWVAYTNWTYSRTFNVPSINLSYSSALLECPGLDTVSSIRINGKYVGTTLNMFRRYTFHVKDKLKEGPNSIDVTFASPTQYALHQAKSYPYRVPPVCPPDVQNGDCSFNFIRKQANSFSWNWGPSFPTMGIWKPLSLRFFNTASFYDFTAITIKDEKGQWHVKGALYFDMVKHVVSILEIKVYFTIDNVLRRTMSANVTQGKSSLEYDFVIFKDVKLWWPHTHGKPTLYGITVKMQMGSITQSVQRNVGFRTVELIQEPILGARGLSFYFRVNGEPVFMKGSNWIPVDSFNERITPEHVRSLLTSARDANMNMLRVWGGGIYEMDSFYEIADELGILIWQDLMFACALYPTDPTFLVETEVEVRQQVRRLMTHPCIAIWAGNNENEAALAKNWWNTTKEYKLYYKDYVKLYVETLRPIVTEEDPSRPFIISSPTNGAQSEKHGWVSANPYDTHFGDVHFYNYSADGWDWHLYPVSRFTSEYGLQSWCSYEALLPVSEQADRVMHSDFYIHRQHRTNGNKILEDSVASHLPLPQTQSEEEYFKHFIYLSQIDHAVAVKTQSELLRRSQSSILDNGNGQTMGALYWQINDIWQAPTWASIEYGGKWKMLHYYAKNFFSRLLISPYTDGGSLVVVYVEDSVPGANTKKHSGTDKHTKDNSVLFAEMDQHILIVKCYHWSSLKPLKTWTIPFIKPQLAAGEVFRSDILSLLREASCKTPSACFFHFTLQSDTSTPPNALLPVYPKDATGMQKANIQITQVTQKGGRFDISLSTDYIAAFVWVDTRNIKGRFSDNGFIMVDATTTVSFYPSDYNITTDSLISDLTVVSLSDVFL